MPATVTSDLFLSAANILALKVGNNNVSKAYLGETLVFETNFGSSGFQWMTINSVTASTAAGIGQNNITVAITQSGGGMEPHSGMYAAQTFPAEYGVPTGGIQIKNVAAGIFTAVFSQPVTDALVAFASVGQAGTPVTVMVLDEFGAPKPFTPIWSLTSEPWSQTTYQNPVNATQYTQFIGEEGYNIIRVDGAMSSVTFNYTVSENYCTVCFGFVDQNAPPIPGCTDPTANNYNLNATVDDGSCQYCNYGCTDGGANNYIPEATCDDGSCDYCNYGCTDGGANNYNPEATCDDGSCAYDIYGCTDDLACNYNPDATISNGDCGGYVNCIDPSAVNYDSNASCGSNAYYAPECCYDWGNIQYYFAGCEACGFGNFDYSQYDSCGNMFYRGFANFVETNLCDHLCVDGCTDSAANNYNPDATRNDGSCCYDNADSNRICVSCGTVMVYIFDSCGNVINSYLDNDGGQCDGLCPDYYGCTNYASDNYNPNSLVDDGSCLGPWYLVDGPFQCGTVSPPGTTFFVQNDAQGHSRNVYLKCGCTNNSADNYDPTAEFDDGSCAFYQSGCVPGECQLGYHGLFDSQNNPIGVTTFFDGACTDDCYGPFTLINSFCEAGQRVDQYADDWGNSYYNYVYDDACLY